MRIAVVGLGRWGSKVAGEYTALLRNGNIDGLTLCDVNPEQLEGYYGYDTSSSIGDVVDRVDGVHICTPNPSHFEVAQYALQHGCHVLVEKPMTMNSGRALQLSKMAEEEELTLQVGHIYRFANVTWKLRQLVQNWTVGKPYYFHCTWTHLMPSRRRVDVLWDLLPHPLDIIHFTTGQYPVAFTGLSRCFRRERRGELAWLHGDYEAFTGLFHLSWLNPTRTRRMQVVGEKGCLTVNPVEQTIHHHHPNGTKREVEVEGNNTIRSEILNFTRCIERGENHHNSAEVGVENVQCVEKALREVNR